MDVSGTGKLPVQIMALDGTSLAGTLFLPSGAPRAAALMNAGGGVAAYHYHHFAQYLASRGIATLTFDYRGIGASRPASLRGFLARVEDWCEFDTGGAIEWMGSRFPGVPLIGLTHSIGAMLLIGAPGAKELTKIGMIVPHTGFWGDYRLAYRMPMAAVWHVLMPAVTKAFGYFPARKLGLGDDIPEGVAMQWAARWHPRFKPTGSASQVTRLNESIGRARDLAIPALAVSISDDGFATAAGARRVLQLAPRLSVHRWHIKPAELDRKRVGHFGFFRKSLGLTLWPEFVIRLVSTENASTPCGHD